MYSPAAVARRQEALESHPLLREIIPRGLVRHPVDECLAFSRRLEGVWADGALTRPLTAAEQTFIVNERLLVKCDFRYWGERYAQIDKEGQGLRPLYPLWESQEIVLAELGRQEDLRYAARHPDGLLACILKARQLGVSTLSMALLTHRTTTHTHFRALVGGDVPDQSSYLFEMIERVAAHLPWWLKPAELKHVASGERPHIYWANKSVVRTESGKSMRGQLVSARKGSQKGEVGRGKTYAGVHLSELATWEHPEQLDGSLFPGIPITPQTLAVLESTAKGRHNWWHQRWLKAEQGIGRFFPVFIPWYAEKKKYWLPAPADWSPKPTTLAHAAQASEAGPRYLHHRVTLSRHQLYWYERTRAEWEEDDRLSEFLAEYPATPEESFQHSGRTIFSLPVRERVAAQARKLVDVWSIAPAALLAEWARQERAALKEGHV